MSENIKIYTDGSCLKNPGGAGGWAFVILDEEGRHERSGHLPSCTSNEAEAEAIIQALEFTKNTKISIYSDSQIALGWIKNSKSISFVHKDNRIMKIIKRIAIAAGGRTINANWVRGHSGQPENERCDQMAGEAARMKPIQEDELEYSFQYSLSR